MELFIDKEALKIISINLEQEIEEYKNKINCIYKDIDSLQNCWSGARYQFFMEQVSKNRNSIENSHLNIKEYSSLIQYSLNNYTNLSEGVHYNE